MENVTMTKVDALAMYSANPASVPASLLSRERVIVGILAARGVPMHAEAVRTEYLGMVIDNVKFNILLMDLAMELEMIANRNYKWMTADEAAKTLEKAQEMYTKSEEGSKEGMIKLLSDMFHEHVPKKRKASIVINGMTVQSMLDNLAAAYANFVETREMPSGRRFYYLNGEFRKSWLKGAQGMPETVGRDGYQERRAEIEFYGAVNSRLGRKIEWAIGALGKYVEAAAAGKGKDARWVAETQKGLREIGVTEEENSKKTNVRIGDALMPLDEAVAEYLNIIVGKMDALVASGVAAEKERRMHAGKK